MKTRWVKSPDWLSEVLDQVLDSLPDDIQPRQMFGYPCAFLNGNLFIGLHQDNLIMRLNEADRHQLIENEEAEQFEPMRGKPMKEYITAPQDWLENDLGELKTWAKRAYDHAKSLPPKIKKAK